MTLTVHSPEEVVIALEPAGLARRFWAFLIDLLLISGAVGSVALICRFLPDALSSLLLPTVSFALFWGYHVWWEVRHEGQSIGKRVLGLRVVDTRGLPVSLQQSMVRNVVRVIDTMPAAGIGMICALLDPHHRRIGDLLAETVVVSEQVPSAPAAQALLARRHNSLDTPRLRRLIANRITLDEREFLLTLLLRAPRLDDAVRYALFEQVGAWYRIRLDIDDPHLSGENLIRNLTPLCFPSR